MSLRPSSVVPKPKLILSALALLIIFSAPQVFSYDVEVIHPGLTQAAIGLFEKQSGIKLTARQKQWIIQGAREEDTDPRYLNHFYSPQTQQGLNYLGASWTSALNWANHSQLSATGDYSLPAALENYRLGNQKRAYQAIGHLLHLVQDMAVPAHTRLDPHPPTDPDPYEGWTKNNAPKYFLPARFTPLRSLEQAIQELAIFTSEGFLSKDTLKTTKNDLKNIEKVKNKDYVIRYWKNKKYKYVRIDVSGITPILYIKDPLIHSDYWRLLSEQAISYSAAAIDYLIKQFQQIDQQKQASQKQSFWRRSWQWAKDKAKSATYNFAYFYGDAYNATKAVANHTTNTVQKASQTPKAVAKKAANVSQKALSALASASQKVKVLGTELLSPNPSPPLPVPKSQPQNLLSSGNHSLDAAKSPQPAPTLAYVIDGDTFVLSNGEKVRLVGIDAPELNNPQNSNDDECLASAARQRLKELLQAGTLRLQVDNQQADRDKYGRLLRWVWAGNILVNSQMAEEGLAKTFFCQPYWKNCPPVKNQQLKARLLASESNARRQQKGIYSAACQPKPMPQPEQPQSQPSLQPSAPSSSQPSPAPVFFPARGVQPVFTPPSPATTSSSQLLLATSTPSPLPSASTTPDSVSTSTFTLPSATSSLPVAPSLASTSVPLFSTSVPDQNPSSTVFFSSSSPPTPEELRRRREAMLRALLAVQQQCLQDPVFASTSSLCLTPEELERRRQTMLAALASSTNPSVEGENSATSASAATTFASSSQLSLATSTPSLPSTSTTPDFASTSSPSPFPSASSSPELVYSSTPEQNSSSTDSSVPPSPFASSSAFTAIHPVISQIQYGSAYSAYDEFVELYNPTNQTIDLTGWRLSKKSRSGKEYNLVASFPSNTALYPRSFLLIAHPLHYQGEVEPNLTYSNQSNSLANHNSVLLYNQQRELVDKVGWGAKAADFEAQPFLSPAFAPNQALCRRSASSSPSASAASTSTFSPLSPSPCPPNPNLDSDNNQNDFILTSQPSPRSQSGDENEEEEEEVEEEQEEEEKENAKKEKEEEKTSLPSLTSALFAATTHLWLGSEGEGEIIPDRASWAPQPLRLTTYSASSSPFLAKHFLGHTTALNFSQLNIGQSLNNNNNEPIPNRLVFDFWLLLPASSTGPLSLLLANGYEGEKLGITFYPENQRAKLYFPHQPATTTKIFTGPHWQKISLFWSPYRSALLLNDRLWFDQIDLQTNYLAPTTLSAAFNQLNIRGNPAANSAPAALYRLHLWIPPSVALLEPTTFAQQDTDNDWCQIARQFNPQAQCEQEAPPVEE